MKSPLAQVLLSAACLVLSLQQLPAETVQDRQGAVLNDRAQMQSNDRWIYNDWKRGFAEAKRTGKPLLVVLRCVPCLACAGIDANILSQSELQPLLDKFVCVRVINANALDLSLFQFDYDLSFSTIFFNGDGTVYGRFGSWMHQKNSAEGSTASYKAALEGALKIHKSYPGNKETLKGKQGVAMPVDDPLQLPQLAGKYKRELDWDGKVVQSCVHSEHAAAKKAGFRKGDILLEIDGISNRITESALIGQLLVRHSPGTKLKARVLRGAEHIELTLPMQ